MRKKTLIALLAASHCAVFALGIGLGIYLLPLLIAPAAPTIAEINAVTEPIKYTGQFRKNLKDSDFLHWGEGKVSISPKAISLTGKLAPGPDYRLYLSPEFIETEKDFLRIKARSVQLGDVKTFENFFIPVPATVDISRYNTVVIWCESFSQFITAAQYR